MKNFIPKNYDLFFQPDLGKFTYSCVEIITFDITQETDSIELDITDLKIKFCKLIRGKKEEQVKFETSDKSLKLNFTPVLKSGIYKIIIQFEGFISNFLAGMYRSNYKIKNEQKYFVTTHFEPADARRVFPCIDHPSYKATFDISVEIDKNLSAVSNMLPLNEKSVGKNKKLITFARSPLMSTYLLYLGVGDFEFKELKYKDILIRGVTTPGKSKYTKFALVCAKKFIAYFEEYFDFPYPLPKVDLIAVADFAAGAMEQWGAITFRENNLLFIEGKTSIAAKQRIAEVIAHELAHQWFGNLVTMKWWDDLWLNESFATFMAYKALNHYYPEWHIWTQYLTDTVFGGMKLDSLKSSHPIQVKIDEVSQVNELFDEIAYDKGGSILRMLEEYLSHDVFRDGLRQYIGKFKYSNAQGADLWNCLEDVSKKPVATLMKSFVTQTGFPSISINLHGATLAVRQERFSFEQDKNPESWQIPLVIQDDRQITRHLLEGKDHSFLLEQTPKFINTNFMYSGFYISVYSNDTLLMLGKNLHKVSALDRAGILHDLYFAVLASRRTIIDLLEFIEKFYKDEKDSSVLIYLLAMLVNSYWYLRKERLQSLIIRLAVRSLEIVNRRPQPDEDPDNSILRNSAIYALSLFDHNETMNFAYEQFQLFLKDETSLHQDMRGVIYGLAVWGKEENYFKILELYRSSGIHEERMKFLSALPRVKKPELLQKTLDLTLSEEVRFADIIYIFSTISRNPHAKDVLIDWLFGNWENLVKNGGGIADMLLRHVLKYVVPSSGIGHYDEMKNFLYGIKSVNLDMTIKQVLEELEVYSRFAKLNNKILD